MHQDAPVPLLVPVAGAPWVAPGPTGPRRHHAVDPHIIKTVEIEGLPVEIVGTRNVTLLPLGQPLRARLAPLRRPHLQPPRLSKSTTRPDLL
jgi:hypothetical protein